MRASRQTDFDVVVLGAGFGGSILASALARRGRRVLLLEKGRHPRFAIGESSTPLANLLLEEVGRRFDLPELIPFTQWGTWQRHHPEVGCGLKRGFTFYHHRPGQKFEPGTLRENEMLVAASPNDEVADTHWYRPDFDAWSARLAVSCGVHYSDRCALQSVELDASRSRLRWSHEGHDQSCTAGFVVDATGPRGALSRLMPIEESPPRWMPATQAVFAHFSGVERIDQRFPPGPGAPYAPDDAAVHHLFDGGWVWILRFNNRLTSAGGVWTGQAKRKHGWRPGPESWAELLKTFPGIAEDFACSRLETALHWMPEVGYRASRVVGPGWALLPSAAGFIDPLLSTGFPLALWGILRLVSLLTERDGNEWDASLRNYEEDTLRDLDSAEDLVSALYAVLPDFTSFKRMALLYFAAASYSELAWRLGVSEKATAFLLRKEPQFSRACRELCERSRQAAAQGAWETLRSELATAIPQAIAPLDAAGLSVLRKPCWYPVDAQDVIRNADKFGLQPQVVEARLKSLVGA